MTKTIKSEFERLSSLSYMAVENNHKHWDAALRLINQLVKDRAIARDALTLEMSFREMFRNADPGIENFKGYSKLSGFSLKAITLLNNERIIDNE